jgi:transketolase
VVSMPCREWFDEQDDAYCDSVIPPDIKARVSIEAGVGTGWRDEVGDHGRIICIHQFGASAAGAKLMEEFGFTPATVVKAAKESIADAESTLAPTHRAPAGPKGPVDLGEHPSGIIS